MPNSPSRANILIVDDTLENLRLLAAILAKTGHEVRPVTNGPQALQAAEFDPPDLVLLDITMPEMDGYAVCAALKKHERLKDIPVIFLTALNEVADKVRAFELGGVDYITKPFQLEEVLARVQTHLSLRRASVELAQKHQRLEALEKLRDDLVHMVVHDMRSPLAALLVHLELLQTESTLGAEGMIDLLAAIRGAQTLNRMTNDLLDVSRMENGKMPLQVAEHELSQLAKHAVAALKGMERERVIAVEPSGLVHAHCDAGLIGRVLENLIGNAIKHTPTGGSISISVVKNDGRVKVMVSDQGSGVPAEARQRIFEKFATVAGATSTKYHSAGLGLAFCKLAVEAHGGTIGVEPRDPQGSQFWFELPAGPP